LRADEASSLYLALENPPAIVQVFATSDPHLPLYFLIEHYWTAWAGISELASRFTAIFVGVLTVGLTYALGKQIFPRRPNVALLGAALIAINPFLIWDSQDIYMYSSLTATTLVSFILFLRVFQPRARIAHWLAYVIANVCGLYFHYFFAFILLAQGILWLYWLAARRIQSRAAVGWMIAQSVTLICFLPWLALAGALLTSFHSEFIPSSSLLEMIQRALLTFTVGRADTRMAPAWIDPTLGSILSLGFLAVFLIGFKFDSAPRGNSDRNGLITLAAFLGVPLLAFFIYSLVRFPLFDERYVLYISAAFALILARGIANLLESKSMAWLGLAACGFILISDGYALYNYFHVPEFARSPDWHSFMQRLAADARPGDVIVQNYPDPAMPYYLQNRLPRVLLPRTGSATMKEVAADLDRLTTKYTRIWIQPSPHSDWDTEGLVATWLERHARLINSYEFRGVQLALYLPFAETLRQAQPLAATFTNHAQLLAFDSTAASHPGDTIQLTLYWKMLEPSPIDATVFAHLYDASGKLQSQQDNAPVHGTYPFDQWQAGETVVDAYTLRIPNDAPRERYTLTIGMYDSQSQVRLHIMNDSRDEWILQSFEVAP